jgi:outer membrane protein
MMQRSEQFQQEAAQNMQKAQTELMAPISKKVEDAIKAVGEAENLVYIFDLARTSIPFVNEKLSVNVTPLVKAKLGLKYNNIVNADNADEAPIRFIRVFLV